MAVNAQSVIPTWIQAWNPDFYDSLTSKEDWSYTNQGTTGWLPLYQALATAMDSYHTHDRTGEVSDFFFSTYGYLAFHSMYGTSGALVPQMDANYLYSMFGFVGLTIGRPVDYYNDILAAGLDWTSAKMQADTAYIGTTVASETTFIGGVTASAQSTIQQQQFSLLFTDIAVIGTVNKDTLRTTYFTTLHWKTAFQNLTINLPLPPGA